MVQDSLVSIILPVFNCEHTVGDALRSIIRQDYQNLEIIIINDGSTDGTEEVIRGIHDPRIVFLNNPTNLGLIATLNKGLERATGEYIARMDGDDIAFPSRITEQVEYMQRHPRVGLLGTNVIQMGESSAKVRFQSNPNLLKGLLLFQNEFAHPTVMMRREVMVQNNLSYEAAFLHVEDYALWLRFSWVSDISNLQKYLLKYRVSKDSISQLANRNTTERDQKHIMIHRRALRVLGLEPSLRQLRLHRAMSAYSPYRIGNKSVFFEAKDWLLTVQEAMLAVQYIPAADRQELLAYQWYVLCGKSSQLGAFCLRNFYFQREFNVFRLGLSKHLKLIGKCLLKYKRKNATDLID